jgi:hypothetical protein
VNTASIVAKSAVCFSIAASFKNKRPTRVPVYDHERYNVNGVSSIIPEALMMQANHRYPPSHCEPPGISL